MKIKSLKLKNFKSFKNLDEINFSDKVNVIIGENNSGKSALLQALYAIQKPGILDKNCIHEGEKSLNIELGFDKIDYKYIKIPQLIKFKKSLEKVKGDDQYLYEQDRFQHEINLIEEELTNSVEISLDQKNAKPSFGILTIAPNPDTGGVFTKELTSIKNLRPNNFIVPFFSQRNVTEYKSSIGQNHARRIEENLSNLPAMVDIINNPEDKRFTDFRDKCYEILGFNLTTYSEKEGKNIYYKADKGKIRLNNLGQGVAHILGLIAELLFSEDKLILIEELENDIHPKALKKLLQLIEEKSDTNQFIVTTHSNIVLRHLGKIEDAKIFRTSLSLNSTPTTKIKEIKGEYERIQVLEELGYELFDFYLWESWLILEEATIESLINYLIPIFTPALQNKLKTISAEGFTNIRKRFEAINDNFLFMHLSRSVYLNKVWVLVDGGQKETQELNELKRKYVKGGHWKDDNFCQLSNHDLEDYYPNIFDKEIKEINNSQDQVKMKKKGQLVKKIIEWANKTENDSEIYGYFYEIIDFLKSIEKEIS